MKLNTIIKFPDGREATVCYHNLDGYGAVYGRHVFKKPYGGFGDELPEPDIMLKDKEFKILEAPNETTD